MNLLKTEFERVVERNKADMAAIIAAHGGSELVRYLESRGLQAKHAPTVACFVNAVVFAIEEPEQYEFVFNLLNEGIKFLELANDGSEASQVDQHPLCG
jgi:hypothetical protein